MKIGIFAPSSPAHIWFREKYLFALQRLEKLGFEVVEGNLVKNLKTQGYRTSTAKERAEELMELIKNESIDIIMPVIGGYNTGSILPYLDYEKIEKSKKIFCGYSDITALHLAILSKTNLPTIYGASLIPTFGEYHTSFKYSEEYFFHALNSKSYSLSAPEYWSDELLDAFTDEWKNKRSYKINEGWKIIFQGECCGEVIIANIDTLVSLLGSEYLPNLKDKILILEEEDATISVEERNLNALKLAGIFDNLKGLIFSKPEKFDDKKSGLTYEQLIREIVESRNYPVVYNFDCGHTHPSIPLSQKSKVFLKASNFEVEVKILENSIYNLRRE